jgi:glucose/arabinose dehydrogenase
MRYLLITGVVACAAFAQDFKLPAPFATPSVRNNSKVIDRPAGVQLKVPAGFTVEEYMTGFERPRKMILGPNKELVIADSAPAGKGVVYVAQGKEKRKLIEGLDRPFGLAFW